jgi:Kef-type K+ transport system membrane component KefB
VLPLAAVASIVLLLIHFDWKIYVTGGIALVLSAIGFFVRWLVQVNRRQA